MRYWSLLFGLAAALCVATFVYAPLDQTWWLPGYRATNAASLATLDALEEGLPGLVEKLERGLSVGDDRAEAKWWLEEQQKAIGQLIDRQFLASRSRRISDSLVAAGEGIDAGDPPGLDQAKAAVAGVRREIQEARAAIGGPDGDLDGPVSSAGRAIDHLFVLILGITGLTFVGTMIALVWFTWKYAASPDRRAVYSHGSLKVEMVWTIIPAAILIFIAYYQLGAWAETKFPSRRPDMPPTAEVMSRQFMWRVRYPGPDGKLHSADDLVTVNDLHFVRGEPVLLHLRSEDVIHSFFLPQFRIKQDAMPGWTVPVWFDCDKAGRYELLCAELCGWGHYKMRADVIVHEDQADFDEWMNRSLAEQNRSQPPDGAESTPSEEPTR